MSRLIDADVFEVVCFQGKSEEFCEGAKYILEMLDAQPTAFDVDEVIKQLEDDWFKVDGLYDDDGYKYKTIKVIPLDDAINIVKRGGVK